MVVRGLFENIIILQYFMGLDDLKIAFGLSRFNFVWTGGVCLVDDLMVHYGYEKWGGVPILMGQGIIDLV